MEEIKQDILQKYIKAYKENFAENFAKEKYKWQAVKHFQENWDINADNFLEMYKEATKLAGNLLSPNGQKRPIQMISEYCNEGWTDKIKTAFINLFDENKELFWRINTFLNTIENIRNEINPKYKAYHDLNTVSVYLWLKNPDKYFIYKYTVIKEITEKLDTEYRPQTRHYDENYPKTQDLYKSINNVIIEDNELLELFKANSDDSCYMDKNAYLLTQDLGYFISKTEKINADALETTTSQGDNMLPPLNQILYGPPGTGKTYETKEYMHTILDDNTALKTPNQVQNNKTINKNLYWYQAIALTMYIIDKNKSYKVNDIKDNQIMLQYAQQKNSKKVYLTMMSQLQVHSNTSSKTVNLVDKKSPALFDKTDESEWYLTENGIKYIEENLSEEIQQINTLKQQKKTEDFYRFITFHQSYSYEEFVEGIRPTINDNEEDKQNISYEYNTGIFKEICQQANSDPENKYLLIIDEINRGNISKIFGELITLIEVDKRIIPNAEYNFENTKLEKNQLLVTLPYTKQKFGVPSNLYIIGTMNTSDRSIASVDIALRRRFKFVEMMPKPELFENVKIEEFKTGKTLKDLLETLNKRISILLDRDHQIGHSYFINFKDKQEISINELKNVWFDEIMPLLNEYFYGDWDKLQDLLGAPKDNGSFIKKLDDVTFARTNISCDISEQNYDFLTKDECKDNQIFLNAIKNAFGELFEEKTK